jgi:hypothetical protein
MAVLQYSSLLNTVATTATSGSTTTLINTSATVQIFTGTANQTLILPVATTFTKPGISYQIYNFSTGSISVQYQDTTAFQTITSNSTLIINCYNASTANGQWTTLTNSTVPSVNAPTIQVLTSGSTYTAPTSPSPLYLVVEMVGGGGGGGGSDGGSSGGTGGTTTFGSSLLTCTGGVGGTVGGELGGAGGTATIGVGATGVAFTGGTAGGMGNAGAVAGGSSGASSPFGGAGGGSLNNTGVSGISGTGSGGGGACFSSGVAGTGGGAGGYLKAQINSPASTYSFSVGAGGAGGAGGNENGGSGGSGIIIVREYYS